ncbi:hypothetical protein [uncultured Sphingomonas sp.]|uniref:spike base protein, RCAP_Rcc01079 family n=1 Tax=uncultured Sphingomonas sp. TaxID=158754 RepID=UPI0025D8FDDE|nr:hypothetical protein [uncultured Sphingomonas sp.]
MTDPFSNVADAPSAPATRLVPVVPHDTNPLSEVPKALYIGTGGTIVLAGVAGDDATLINVSDGTILPIRARFVRASGTTAHAIVGLY